MTAIAVPAPPRRRRRLLALVIAGAVALAGAGAAAAFVLGGDEPSAVPVGSAVVVESADVAGLARDREVFWLGERPGERIEASRGTSGEVWLRYLTADARPGDARPAFLTVGTYPVADAHAAVVQAAEQKGAHSEKLDDGTLVTWRAEAPTNVYLAAPDATSLVEVYSPDAKQAQGLALGGAVHAAGE